MSRRLWPVVSLAALTLAGCGGGSGDVVTAPPPPPPPTQQTLANSSVGTTFTATAGQGQDSYTVANGMTGAGVPYKENGNSSSIQTTATGLTIAYRGATANIIYSVDISATSPQRIGGSVYAVPSISPGTTYTFIDGPRFTYATYGAWHTDTVPRNRTTTAANAIAYGVESTPGQMRATGTATFNGFMSGVVMTSSETSQITNGTVRFDANFATGAISGRATDLVWRSSDGLRPFANIVFSDGRISGTSFAGTTSLQTDTPRSPYNLVNTSGTFGGKFYGPNAVEAAGSFALEGYAGEYVGEAYNKVAIVGAFATTSDSASTVTQVPAPPTPSPAVPTLAEVPIATSPLGSSYSQIAVGYSVTGATNSPTVTVPAVIRADIRKTEIGFDLWDNDNDKIRFDTSATSTQRVGTNQYFAAGDPTIASPKSVQFLAAQALTYSTYGIWAQVPQGTSAGARPGASAATHSGGVVAYGVGTSGGEMPVTGTARFTGGFAGFFAVPGTFGTVTSGDAQLDVNFASREITGSIRNVIGVQGRTSNATPTTGRLNDLTLTGNIRVNDYRGTATAVATPGVTYDLGAATGVLAGAFHGPAAVETAGVVSLTGTGTFLQGAFAAGRQ